MIIKSPHEVWYFKALDRERPRTFAYEASKKKTEADVVSLGIDKQTQRVSFARHPAFKPRFERLGEQWYLATSPTLAFHDKRLHASTTPIPACMIRNRYCLRPTIAMTARSPSLPEKSFRSP